MILHAEWVPNILPYKAVANLYSNKHSLPSCKEHHCVHITINKNNNHSAVDQFVFSLTVE